MNIGKLKYRVTFRQPTATEDSVGGFSASYANVQTTWANVEQMSGRFSDSKELQFGAVSAESGYEITVRTRFDVRPNQNWEIVYNGKTLQIHSVVEVDKKTLVFVAYQNKRAETGNIATDWSQS